VTDAEIAKLTELVQALAAARRVEPTRALFMSYEVGLGDLPIADVEAAIIREIRHGGAFMKSPGEIRAMCGGQTLEMRALLAWTAVRRAISKYDEYYSVQFDDPAATAAIRVTGGWVRLCNLGGEDLETWGRKEFEKAYAEFVSAGVTAELARPLDGLYARAGNVDAWSTAVRRGRMPGIAPAQIIGPAPRRQVSDGRDAVEGIVKSLALKASAE